MIKWQWAEFTHLSSEELYQITQARQDVFIVEQNCIYADIDGRDQDAWHLIGWDSSTSESSAPKNLTHSKQAKRKKLKAYLRIVYPNPVSKAAFIGRVLVIKEARGLGLGKELIKEALKKMNSEHHALAISLSAQLYLLKFYESFGFHAVSEAYDEDGIQHIDMLKQ